MNLKDILEYLYKEEQNVSLTSFWDGGWDFALGDECNGITWHDNFCTLDIGAQAMLKAYEEMKDGKK